MAHILKIPHSTPVLGGITSLFGGGQQKIQSQPISSSNLPTPSYFLPPSVRPVGPSQPGPPSGLYQPPSTLGISTGGGGGGTPFAPSQIEAPQLPVPSGPDQNLLDLIEQDYNQTTGTIGTEEERIKGELPSEIAETERQQVRKKTALEQERAGRLGQITTREQEQTRATQGALEQLRQLYQEVQRRQVAQLSAGGLTRSSAAEALSTLLGREMAQRVSGQLGTRDEVLRNLADETKRTKDYFSTQISTLEQETADRIQQVRNQFNLALRQLNQLRGQASIEKQRGRANLFQQFNQQVLAIQQANNQAKLTLDQWKQQMELKLAAAQKSAFNLPDVATQIAQIQQAGLEPSNLAFTRQGVRIGGARPRAGNILDLLEEEGIPETQF